MYNRYIPNGKGSFDCQHVPSPRPAQKPGPPPAPAPPPPKPPAPPASDAHRPPKPAPPPPPPEKPPGSALQLHLPEKLDTGDLLVLLVLLLVLQEDEDPLATLLALGAFLLCQ